MITYALPNANGSVIAVTSTATNLYSLINTAASTTTERAGLPVEVNMVILQPEDGDIRVLFNGLTPTASKGMLIGQGEVRGLVGIDLSKLLLIRTGGSNVAVNVTVGKATDGDVSFSGGNPNITLAEFPAAATLTDNFATPTTTSVGAFGMVYDGSTWDFMRGTAADGVLVNLGGNNDVAVTSIIPGTGATNLGKANSSAAGATDTGVAVFGIYNQTEGNLGNSDLDYSYMSVDSAGRVLSSVSGGVAAGATDSGNPVKVGGKYNSTQPTLTNGQRGDVQLDDRANLRVAYGTGATLPSGTNTIGNVGRAKASAATLANVSSSASSTTLQASNASRIGWLLFNDSAQPLKVKFGATASSTSFTVEVASQGYYEMPEPIYTGIIDGIWDSADGSARVTELT